MNPLIILRHMDGDADRTGLIGECTGDPLTNPPGRVCTKLKSAPIIKALGRLHETDISFLHEVQQAQPSPIVMFGEVYNQAEIGKNHFSLRLFKLRPSPSKLLPQGM